MMKYVVRAIVLTFALVQFPNAFAGWEKIQIPSCVPAQSEKWSCGPNSAARFLHFFQEKKSGTAISSFQCKSGAYPEFLNSCPKSLDGSTLGCDSVGPYPELLVSHLNAQAEGITFAANHDDDALSTTIASILSGYPVIALIKTGDMTFGSQIPSSFQGFLPSNIQNLNIPLLHYVVLNGYNDETNELSYVDTDGTEKIISSDSFKAKLDWKVDADPSIITQIKGIVSSPMILMFAPGLRNVPGLLDAKGNTLIQIESGI